MLKKLFLAISLFGMISHAKMLIVQESAIMNALVMKDIQKKVASFKQKLQQEQIKIQKKLQDEREALKKIANSKEYTMKLQAWEKKVENAQKKLMGLMETAEEATQETLMKITSQFEEIFKAISIKHGKLAIFKDSALAYPSEDAVDITAEFLESANKQYKQTNLSLPMIILE